MGAYALVADASTFRKKAARLVDRGRVLLVADMPVHPIPGHKWSEYLVPTDQLASRLGTSHAMGLLPDAVAETPADEDHVIGGDFAPFGLS